MATNVLSIEPMTAGFGAVVRDLDCTRLDEGTKAALRDAWRNYRVLIFRNSVKNDDELVALGATFGDLIPSRFASPLTTRSEVMIISNILVDGKLAGGLPDGEIEWHYDGMHQATPYKGAILYATEVPRHGGETRFADMCRAYEMLPDALKRRLEGLTAASSYDYNAAASAVKQISSTAPRAVHPVVRDVADTGRKAIYVAKLMTDRILEVDEAESREILDALYAYMDAAPAYEHPWTVGDAVLWNNHSVVHARNDFSAAERRLLKRVTIT